MPVSGMNDLQVEIPSSFRSSSFVPSPFIIVALGSSMLSSSQRSLFCSIIFTEIPILIKIFAR